MMNQKITAGIVSLASIASLGAAAPAFALHTGLVGDVFVDFDTGLIRPSGVVATSIFGDALLGGCGGGMIDPCLGAAIAPPMITASPCAAGLLGGFSPCSYPVIQFSDCYWWAR